MTQMHKWVKAKKEKEKKEYRLVGLFTFRQIKCKLIILINEINFYAQIIIIEIKHTQHMYHNEI
jgi:hypothetical protein